ncbi:325_t:CDS:2 [Diversispora eburnea]|uniref:glucan endo-1,3-beta-D-glucosidase n=1 Tax=Diversispora eburnea TaxID=1213867 RepID=A0A9N8ZX61_9GLOM|nr:325_t:CDS:2 [Diversispora eburnea]
MVDPNASEWLKSQQKSSRRHRIIVLTIGILILLGIIGGVVYFLKFKSPSGTSSDNSSNENNGNIGTGNNSSPNKYFTWDKKPVNLTIVPNPKLKNILYGINYGPVNASYPWCTNTLGDVIEDIKIVSQVTNRIRLYGMDCHAVEWTLEAINLLKLNMTIVPTIWVDNNDTTYQRQFDDFFDVVNKYELDVKVLYQRIADVRKKINSMGFKKTIPVFTSDLGSNVDKAFTDAVDEVWANIHPYFGGLDVKYAAAWSFNFTDQNNGYYAKQANKESVMSEIGWPTAGDPHGQAVASINNLQIFLDTFVCAANTKKVKYYYFEALDAPWKVARWTLLEGSWGLFNPDGTLKDITFPNCN